MVQSGNWGSGEFGVATGAARGAVEPWFKAGAVSSQGCRQREQKVAGRGSNERREVRKLETRLLFQWDL